MYYLNFNLFLKNYRFWNYLKKKESEMWVNGIFNVLS